MNKKHRAVLDVKVQEMLALVVPEGEWADNGYLHGRADDILLEALRELGFGELADAWEKVSEVGFWYE